MSDQDCQSILFTECELASLRDKLNRGVHLSSWRNVLRVANERISWRLATEPPPIPLMRGGWQRGSAGWREIDGRHAQLYQEHYRAAALVRNMIELFSFVYVVSGESRFLERATDWLLLPCNWAQSTWAAYADSELPLGAYSLDDLETMARSGGELVRAFSPRNSEQLFPVFEDAGILTTFKLRGMAIGYSLLRNELKEETRKRVARKIALHADRLYLLAARGKGLLINRILNHTWFDVAGLGLAALALLDEHPRAPDWLRLARDKYEKSLLPGAIGADGEFPEPAALLWEFALTNACVFLDALRRVTGDDLFELDPMRRVPHFLLSVLSPTGGLAFDEEATFDAAEGMWYALRPVMLLFAARYRDPSYQWWALHDSRNGLGEDRGRYYPGGPWFPREREYNGYYELLWYDDKVRPKRPSRRSASIELRDVGWAMLRSGWTSMDTFIAFKSGPFLGPHDKLDQNKFVLSAHGEKLIERVHTTCYGDSQYYRNTQSNCTILIDGEGQSVERHGLTNYHRFVLEYKRDDRSGRIVACKLGDLADYVVGDATRAYRSLSLFRRHIVFVKPQTVLVIDDLVAPRAHQFDWLLQTRGEIDVRKEAFEVRKPAASLVGFVLSPDGVQSSKLESPLDFEGVRRPYLRLRSPRGRNVRFVVLLAPLAPGQESPSVTLVENSKTVVVVRVDANYQALTIRVDLPGLRAEVNGSA